MLRQTPQDIGILRVDWILFATAFAAGCVDIIGFTSLGGVFASAMTGNFALLAYHVAQGNSRSAIGSLVALAGFVTGCVIGFVLRRGRAERTTLELLLGAEMGLLLVFALQASWNAAPAAVAAARLMIVTLAVAMGLQAVVGQMISHSTIVFTTTLTRLVGGVTNAIAAGNSTALADVKVPLALVASYLIGALLAGFLSLHGIRQAVFLPLAGVAVAFGAQRFFGRR